MDTAALLLLAFATYVVLGVLFAAAFVAIGVGRIDAAAHRAPIGFRLLIFPGTAVLWPYLLLRWVRVRRVEAL